MDKSILIDQFVWVNPSERKGIYLEAKNTNQTTNTSGNLDLSKNGFSAPFGFCCGGIDVMPEDPTFEL